MKGHIRARGKNSWTVKFDVGRDPITGKRLTRWHTVHGGKREAQRKLAELIHAANEGTYVEPTRVTVAEYLGRWLAHARSRVAARTFERYEEIARKHLVPALGGLRLAKLAPMHVQAYYADALAHGRRRRKDNHDAPDAGLSAQTVKHHHRVLSQALRQAVRWQMLGRNPCDAVQAPRPVRRDMRTLDHAQSAALIKAADGRRAYVPVLLALTTGMRRGEILGLRWRDVNLDDAALSVAQTLEQTAAGCALKAPKTPRSRRTITLPTLTVEALRRHKAQQAAQRLRLGPIYRDMDLVCPAEDGNPQSPRALTKTFQRLAAEIGLAVRFHDLRHTHISHLLLAGVHPKVASERAGHASIAITLDVYSHVMPGMQEDAAKRVDAALRKALDA